MAHRPGTLIWALAAVGLVSAAVSAERSESGGSELETPTSKVFKQIQDSWARKAAEDRHRTPRRGGRPHDDAS